MKTYLLVAALLMGACSDPGALVEDASIEPDRAITNWDVPIDMYIQDSEPNYWEEDPEEEVFTLPSVCFENDPPRRCQVTGVKGECRKGHRRCHNGTWSHCLPLVNPRPDICDARDNDCDGYTDEDILISCYTGPEETPKVGECLTGYRVCLGEDGMSGCLQEVTPVEEVCDGKDNDCDGQTDEEVLNACGECGPLPQEMCNFRDDDCDGTIDEGAGFCNCENPLFERGPEICNGRDDDCDRAIDESEDGGPLTSLCFWNGEELLLGDDIPELEGVCRPGLAFCEAEWSQEEGDFRYGYFDCQQQIVATDEHCDGLDNDCDGDLDEGFEPTDENFIVSFIIDNSTSMDADEIVASLNALENTSRRLEQQGLGDRLCFNTILIGVENQPVLPQGIAPCMPGPIAAQATRELYPIPPAHQRNDELSLDALFLMGADDRYDSDGDMEPDNFIWQRSFVRILEEHEVNIPVERRVIAIMLTDEGPQTDDPIINEIGHRVIDHLLPMVEETGMQIHLVYPLRGGGRGQLNEWVQLFAGIPGALTVHDLNNLAGENLAQGIHRLFGDLGCILQPEEPAPVGEVP